MELDEIIKISAYISDYDTRNESSNLKLSESLITFVLDNNMFEELRLELIKRTGSDGFDEDSNEIDLKFFNLNYKFIRREED